jgi:hypothetical protein
LDTGKSRRKSEDVARELQANANGLFEAPLCLTRRDNPYSGKSDFYRLRQGLHDNLSNAAYAKCAAAADAVSIAVAKHAITS